jgi:hypothetical protein
MTEPPSYSNLSPLRDFWRGIWHPIDRRPIHEWARDNVTLASPLTLVGPPDLSTSRHFLAPLYALQDDRVREVNVLASIRGGKSLIADLWLCWLVVNQPGPYRAVFQDEKAAKDHAERRALKMLRSVRGIAQYLPEESHKDRVKEIILPGGEVVFDGPAIGQLQSRGFRYVCLDEVWLYKPGVIHEAKGRMGDYVKLGNNKCLCLSQGGDEMSDWHAQYASGVAHEWNIRCERCGHFMFPSYRAFRDDNTRWGFCFDDIRDQADLFDVPKIIPTIRFECEKCGHPHIDSPALKAEWNRTGKYIPEETDKDPIRKSFRWNSIIDWPWKDLAVEYLSALNAAKQGMMEAIKAFAQKFGAEFWSDQMAFMMDSRPVQTFEATSSWPEEHIRFMTIDQQGEGIQWAVIRAWAKTGESRRLWFGKLFSTDEARAKQLEFKVRDAHVLKDSGFLTRQVYAECCKFGWIALKGEDNDFFLHKQERRGKIYHVRRSYSIPQRADPEAGAAGEGTRFAKLIRWSVPMIADRLEGLKHGKSAKWSRTHPVTSEEIATEREYDRQLSAEYKKPKQNKFTGKVELVWVCPSGNNHLNDCERMQVLGATLADCLPDLVAQPELKEAEKAS